MRFLAVLLLTSTALPAMAQTEPFFVEEAGWSVLEFSSGSCFATNRPAEEFNFSPYNALALHQGADEATPSLQVFFWPGVVGVDEVVVVTVDPNPGMVFEILTRAASDFHLVGSEPLLPEQVAAMADAETLEIGTLRVSPSLLFRATGIPRVLELMAACRSEP